MSTLLMEMRRLAPGSAARVSRSSCQTDFRPDQVFVGEGGADAGEDGVAGLVAGFMMTPFPHAWLSEPCRAPMNPSLSSRALGHKLWSRSHAPAWERHCSPLR